LAESTPELMLRSARIDADACRVLAAAPAMSDAVVGFHAQQACEKCIKAVLGAAGVSAPRTHDLARLVELLADHDIGVPAGAETVDLLTPYAVAARYGLVSEGALDRAWALARVDEWLGWASAQIGVQP
jgi:HEPN domain-containing protein